MRLTTFASGSSGNCALLSMDGVHLLLDAGISCRRIRQQLRLSGLEPESLSGVLITHSHRDHICGLDVLLRACPLPVLASAGVSRELRKSVAGVESCLRELPLDTPTEFSGLRLRCFPTPHDTAYSVGWRVEGSERFALATDMGTVTESVRRGLLGADAALIEANHDVELLRYGPYPVSLKRRILSDRGHLSNAACAALARELEESGTRYLILGHLSQENNRPELALRTVRSALGDSAGVFVAPAQERLTLETEEALPCCW